MSSNPHSMFGFGVVVEAEGFFGLVWGDDPGSPGSLLYSGDPVGGIRVRECGHRENPSGVLVLAADSVRISPDWSPAWIDAIPMDTSDWARVVCGYVDRWNLRSLLLRGFEHPTYLHAPYYG